MGIFGQIVIGPPGSGKSTYCHAMQQFMNGIGRKVAVINLDPANDNLVYECAVDISELITLSDTMDLLKLGPNGGLVYCMEHLAKNIDWLQQRLESKELSDRYMLFDCPGQVELYTHNDALRTVFSQLTHNGRFRLAAVHLVDAHYCAEPSKFIAVLLTSLAAMLQVEQPHINILSKVDLIEKYGKLPFNLDYFTEVLDLSYLLDHLVDDDPLLAKYKKLNEAMVGVIEDYSLVSFLPLHVENKETMLRVLTAVDRANGFAYRGSTTEDQSLSSLMLSSPAAEFEYDKIAAIQESFIDSQTSQVDSTMDTS